MNEIRPDDVTIISDAYSRIDFIRMYARKGCRLIYHRHLETIFYMLIFRSFELTKDKEVATCKARKISRVDTAYDAIFRESFEKTLSEDI